MSVVAMDKACLTELVSDVTPLWDGDKNCHNRDLKPKLWDEIGEKLNVTGNLIHYFSTCAMIHPK